MISVIIPVYKSTKSLEVLVNQISSLGSKEKYEFEIIFVNDSPFFLDTRKELESIDKKYDFVTVINLRKNQGQHTALLVGLNESQGEYVVTMDDDLQHPVSELPKLINTIKENSELEAVMAIPKTGFKKHKAWRNLGSKLLNAVDGYFLKKPKGLVKGPFKIMTRGLANHLCNNYNATPAINSMIFNATQNVVNITFEHHSREHGESGYSLGKVITLFINNIIHYSSLPLKLLGFIGGGGLFFSFLFVGYILLKKWFWGIDFPGYASTVSLICFFGGLNLFGVGLIGEYLIRILKEQQKVALKDFIHS